MTPLNKKCCESPGKDHWFPGFGKCVCSCHSQSECCKVCEGWTKVPEYICDCKCHYEEPATPKNKEMTFALDRQGAERTNIPATPKNSEWADVVDNIVWNAAQLGKYEFKKLRLLQDELNRVIRQFLQDRSKDTVGEMEIRLRRDRELLIMMDEAERKGWDFNRFIKTFAVLIETKGASPSTPLQKLSEQLNQK